MTDTLIISYAFSPTNTTTSNVVAKRILTNEKNVDVICGSLDNLTKDYSLENILNEYINNKITIKADFSVDWDNICNFVKKGLDELGEYDKIYSRAFFIHSHFLALEYKLKNPDSYWSAEFSDPLIRPLGRRASSEINDENYVNRFNKLLNEKGLGEIHIDDDINSICEYLTLIYCDEIIFTNESQEKAMIETSPFDIEKIIADKYVIKPHPTLDEKYYNLENSTYNIDSSYVNFAYFGNIFSKRTFEDFITAFDNVDCDKIKLHIFTSTKTLFEQVLTPKIYKKSIINTEVNYLEFLNLCNKFDVLLVEDSYTKDDEIVNPYLPSKISDYNGSNTDIWGVCEENSEMSKLNLKYKSKLNDFNSNIETINKILNDKLASNINYIIENSEKNYHRQRINHLTGKIAELITIAEEEFKKDLEYEARINELEKINSDKSKLSKIFKKMKKI